MNARHIGARRLVLRVWAARGVELSRLARASLVAFAALVALVALAGCERRRVDPKPVDLAPPPAMPTAPPPALPSLAPPAPVATRGELRDGNASVACARDSKFPDALDLREASAAAEVELVPGKREILVVSDSGGKGVAALWAIDSGPVRTITLPLDATANDDLEGLAWARDRYDGSGSAHLYALTSSGAVRRFSPDGKGGVVRDHDAYRIGAPPVSCDALTSSNCGRNYEGLCLRTKQARCAGYAASKEKATLYCLVFENGRLVADAIKPPIVLPIRARALSDCAFGAAGGPAEDVLVVTTNVYGMNASYIVDEATGALSMIDVPGTFNNEVIAIDHTGALYQMMDNNGEVSPASRMTCTGWR